MSLHFRFSHAVKTLPPWIFIAIAGLIGGIIGLISFTFSYGRGYSYLSNDPAACINCHIMRPAYDDWMNSSHRNVAVCNDCHTPHGLVAKYATKALSGFNHSLAFTFENFPEPLQIRPLSRNVVRDNCLYCHNALCESISYEGQPNPTDCLKCHSKVGHPF